MSRSIRLTMGVAILSLVTALAVAQSGLTLPPSGDNQKSVVTQYMGPVRVTIEYNSPDVHSPTGADRRGKIWGELVPYGMIDEAFGTCEECPWRAGANENTVLEVSHDVLIEGQPLPAGRYGLFMVADPNEWTLILSKNATSWGHYTYDPAEDALRVKVKPAKSDYHEWLTYEFVDRKPDKTTVALKWEDLQVPWTVSVPNIADIYLAEIRKELRGFKGLSWQNWDAAARYALRNKRNELALQFAQSGAGIGLPFLGQENFTTLSTLADAQEASGMMADAAKTRERALSHATATASSLHQYARQLLNQGKKQEAMKVWQLNARRFGDTWPVHVGLARGYSAMGDYKNALKHAKTAVKQAPDDQNRKMLQESIKKLEAGKDMNT
jgi:tetratricopeptide (TPR) repeat protein